MHVACAFLRICAAHYCKPHLLVYWSIDEDVEVYLFDLSRICRRLLVGYFDSAEHAFEANFRVTCGIDGCQATYKKLSSWKSHLYHNHKGLLMLTKQNRPRFIKFRIILFRCISGAYCTTCWTIFYWIGFAMVGLLGQSKPHVHSWNELK